VLANFGGIIGTSHLFDKRKIADAGT